MENRKRISLIKLGITPLSHIKQSNSERIKEDKCTDYNNTKYLEYGCLVRKQGNKVEVRFLVVTSKQKGQNLEWMNSKSNISNVLLVQGNFCFVPK